MSNSVPQRTLSRLSNRPFEMWPFGDERPVFAWSLSSTGCSSQDLLLKATVYSVYSTNDVFVSNFRDIN